MYSLNLIFYIFNVHFIAPSTDFYYFRGATYTFVTQRSNIYLK
nr:MAG TPA: hypothetical protein [Caudoviricetes sp.]